MVRRVEHGTGRRVAAGFSPPNQPLRTTVSARALDMPIPVTVREISSIKFDGGLTVTVFDIDAGREIKLPKSQVRFEHRRVIIPLWLARRIYHDQYGKKV